MTVQIPIGFAAVSAEMRNEGDPDSWFCTWGVDVSAAGGDWDVVAQISAAAWDGTFMASMNSATTFVGTSVTVGTDGGDPPIVSYSAGTTGIGTSDKLPQNCALLVTKNSGFGGRRNKGRFFVPNVLDESTVNGVGVIAALSLTSFQGVADEFLDRLENATDYLQPFDTPMVILHNSPTAGPTPIPTAVSSLTVDGRISTQRRRLR